MKIIFILTVLLLGCSLPQTRREFDSYAPKNLEKMNFVLSVPLKEAKKRLQDISTQCLNKTWSIHYEGSMVGRMAQPGGTAHIQYHANIEETKEGIFLYLQKEIPSSIDSPEGGFYGMLVQLSKSMSQKNIPVTIYYYDKMGIRFKKIADATRDRLVTANRICSDLNTDNN